MAAPWTPLIHGYATRSKPLPIPFPRLAAPTATPLQPAKTRTPAQIQKDIYAGSISDKWPIPKNRRKKASRGLMNIGNSCYQTSVLQSLYHLRKFMNWILTHNVTKRGSVIDNPCDLTQIVAGQCVACLMKRLIKKYWGYNNITSGDPNALPTTDVDMIAMQSVVDFWFPRIADRHTGLFTYRPQQDAEDFQFKLLQACFNSTNSLLWQHEYNALFSLEYAETWTCGCGKNVPVTPGSQTHPAPELGFQSMAIRPIVPETIRSVINEKLADDYVPPGALTVICPHCLVIQPPITRQYRIEAAPELLRIALNVGSNAYPAGPTKEFNPVQFTQSLDLTDFQRDRGTTLRYRLSSVVHHRGPNYDRGHWLSTVQGHGSNVYYIDDHIVRSEEASFLTSNPQRDSVPEAVPDHQVAAWQRQNQREGVLLIYVRQR